MKIILSYRRADSAGIAGRIFDRFVGHFGAEDVFMDIDNIPFGIDFREHIKNELENSDVVLVIIGLRWLTDAGVRRIDNENDFVRIEVETALQRGIPVIPVLVDGATMPLLGELPNSLRDLIFRNAATIDSGRDFNMHIDRLIRSIRRLIEKSGSQHVAIEGFSAAQRIAANVDRPYRSEAEIPSSSNAVNFKATPHRSLNTLAIKQADSNNQQLKIRPTRQVPVWIVILTSCALMLSIWLAYRHALVKQANHAASEMANVFPPGKIELKRGTAVPAASNTEGGAAEFEGDMTVLKAGQLLVTLRDQVEPTCQQIIGNRYPFVRGSKQDVPLGDFARLFGPNGILDRFFAQSLEQYADMSKPEWAWRKESSVGRTFSPDTLTQFQRATYIRDAFFQNGGNVPVVFLAIQPPIASGPGTSVNLEIGDTVIWSPSSRSAAQISVQWPDLSMRTAVYAANESNGQPSILERIGPWSLFRLLEAGSLSIDGSAATATFILAGRELRYQFTTGSMRNPLNLSLLRDFRCPTGK